MDLGPGSLERDSVRSWLQVSWWYYALIAAAIGALLAAAAFRVSAAFIWALVVLLALALAGLDDVSRRTGDDADGADEPGSVTAPTAPRTRASRARVLVATGLAVIGALAVVLGWRSVGAGADGLFFVGLTVAFLASSALVGEARLATLRHQWLVACVLGVALLFLAVGMLGRPDSWWRPVLVGLVLLEIGTELRSEWRLNVGPFGRRHLLLSVAAVLGALAVMAVLHVGAVYLLVALVVALAVALMAASDTDALVIVLLGALVVVWASSPRSEAPDQDHVARPGDPYYLVLGDSYTSGEGADVFLDGTNTKVASPDGFHTNECRQASTAWGLRLATDPPPSVPSRVLFLGCSGADTENMTADALPAGVGGPPELALYERRLHGEDGAAALVDPPQFAILEAGGNDAGFSLIGRTCVGPGSCVSVADQFLHTAGGSRTVAPGDPEPLADISDDLDAAYDRVASALPEVPIIVTPYPVPITDEGSCAIPLLDRRERQFIVGFVRELNLVVRAAAERHGFLYMDTIEDSLASDHLRLCERRAAGVNFLSLNPTEGSIRDNLDPRNWMHNGFHPPASGHAAMERAARRWFEARPALRRLRPDPTATHEVRSLDAVVRGDTEQCGSSDADRSAPPSEVCDVNGSWLAEQARLGYQRALVPVLVLLVGSWGVALSFLGWARRHHLTTFNVLRGRIF